MHAWRACILAAGFVCIGVVFALRGEEASTPMSFSSPDFAHGQPMPRECAMRGENHSPQLLIAAVPPGAKTLALIVDDPDAPAGLWTHWLLWNIPAQTAVIAKGHAPAGAIEGKNSFGNVRYDGPAPPSGTHRYVFHLYALDTKLALSRGASRDELEAAIKGHVVGTGEFYGTYSAE